MRNNILATKHREWCLCSFLKFCCCDVVARSHTCSLINLCGFVAPLYSICLELVLCLSSHSFLSSGVVECFPLFLHFISIQFTMPLCTAWCTAWCMVYQNMLGMFVVTKTVMCNRTKTMIFFYYNHGIECFLGTFTFSVLINRRFCLNLNFEGCAKM